MDYKEFYFNYYERPKEDAKKLFNLEKHILSLLTYKPNSLNEMSLKLFKDTGLHFLLVPCIKKLEKHKYVIRNLNNGVVYFGLSKKYNTREWIDKFRSWE